MKTKQIIFHGGCHRCTMQEQKGVTYCVGCKFFEADESLPDLNDAHAREELAREIKKQEVKERYYLMTDK